MRSVHEFTAQSEDTLILQRAAKLEVEQGGQVLMDLDPECVFFAGPHNALLLMSPAVRR